MWKKVVPAAALCSFLLVGCNNVDDAVPDNNETPMEDVREDINTPSPNTNNGMNNNGNGNGIIDEGNGNEGINNNGDGVMDGDNSGNGNGNVPNDGKMFEEPITENDDDEIINNNTNNIK